MKNREELISYCLTFKDTYPDQPFHDPNWTVIRHRGSRKVFAWIFEREGRTWVNVKCILFTSSSGIVPSRMA